MPKPAYHAGGGSEPVAVATELDMTEAEGPVTNQWGGVVPEAKPTTPIDNGALGEVE